MSRSIRTCALCEGTMGTGRIGAFCTSCGAAYDRHVVGDPSIGETIRWVASRARWWARRNVSRAKRRRQDRTP